MNNSIFKIRSKTLFNNEYREIKNYGFPCWYYKKKNSRCQGMKV